MWAHTAIARNRSASWEIRDATPLLSENRVTRSGGMVTYRFLYYTEVDPVKIDPQPIKGYRWDCPCGVIGTRSESWSLVTKETSPCRIR